ncbi:MAG TPA: DnaJ domain-containing protein [Deltaproteobacteria bacterium]|jgi:DnaJ-class molecular chaperone|nr:J domain-containing protein [Deltaproteobacteria bacterium]OQC23599.1 MAG: Chaperone protein DnaJ [Deltaproteobacteria bacterium ADurb.Bin072]HRW80521.1 DnaJ domain-containing protein [Desulfomonilia bacterium]NMD40586.1 J domain-containing protein [Deltaproteobacteria bacterium]HNQ86687.1 DnaJ domain-containing protein [Deltaproteobacteria bacterium]
MSKDYYRILGVSRDATSQEIKKSYRMLAMKFHPDRNREDPSTAEAFKEITEAYGVLIDPVKRRTYDRERGFAFNRDTVFDDIFSRSDFRDVFDDLPIRKEWIERILNISRVIAYEALVVGGTPGEVLRRSMVRLAVQRMDRVFHRVMDMHENLDVPDTIALTGGYVTLEYRPGLFRRSIKVKIPRSTTGGVVLRIQGMGRKNPLSRAGDLYLHVSIASSKTTI